MRDSTAASSVPSKRWKAGTLRDVVSLQRGHDLTWRDRRTGDVPVMGSAGLNGFHDTALARGPGVLLGRSGASFGQAHFCSEDFWPHNTALYVTDFLGNEPLFVFYLLKSMDFTQHNTGGAQQSLNRNFIYPIRLAVPELSEQRAIAAALSDVDALIGSLDRLIPKKRDLNQAVMRQLLTGQTRLPTFGQMWEVAQLGSLGRWFSGGTPSMANEDYWSGDIPWVSPKDMKVTRLRDAIDHVSLAALSNGTRLLPKGALLIVVRGMILAHSCPVARAERQLAFNQDIKGLVVRPDVDSDFLLCWLLANEQTLLSTTTVSTHGTKRVATETLFKLEVSLPPLSEQKAIAAVLSDMDAEITALEQRRDKTRLLKQAMMQELLTGRTRLV